MTGRIIASAAPKTRVVKSCEKVLAYRETCGKRRIVDGEPFRQTLAQHCRNIGILGARSMDARRFCLQNHEGMGIDCVDIRKCGMSVDARAACLDTVNALHTRLANRLFGQGKAIGDHSRVRDCSAGGGRIICNEEIDRLPHVADTRASKPMVSRLGASGIAPVLATTP